MTMKGPKGFEELPHNTGYINKEMDLGLCYSGEKDRYVLYDNMKRFQDGGEEPRPIHEFNSMKEAEKFFGKK